MAERSVRAEHFRRMLAYEADATVLALGSIESVPRDVQADERFRRVLSVAGHIQVARRLWLKRLESIGGEPPALTGIDLWPAWGVDRSRWEASDLNRLWGGYIESLDESSLDGELRYTSTEGVEYVSRVHEVVTHVFNHGTYHRGQIARIVHELGGRRASTDFITLTRRRPEG